VKILVEQIQCWKSKPTDKLAFDPNAQQFWEKHFPESSTIDLGTFIIRLEGTLGSKRMHEALHELFSCDDKEHVSLETFQTFVYRFGPWNNLLQNVENIIKNSWFVTVSNFEEAEDLLRGHPVGTFLVRIDSERGKKCGFTVSWVDSINIGSNRNSYHVMHKRIKIEKDENQQSKFIFDKFEKKDLVELVNEFKTIDRLKLQKPYPFSKKMQDFYYGIVKHGDDVFRTAFGQKKLWNDFL